YEAGSPRRLEKPFIAVGIAGVLNALRHLQMMPGEPALPPLSFMIARTHWIRSHTGGILDLRVDLGQPLRRGQEISVNTNPFGRERSQLKARSAGVAPRPTAAPPVPRGGVRRRPAPPAAGHPGGSRLPRRPPAPPRGRSVGGALAPQR